MKTILLLVLCGLVLAVSAVPAAAKKHHKAAAPPEVAAPSMDAAPQAALSPYVEHLDQLLALHRAPSPALAHLLDGAPSRLALYRAMWTEKRKKAEGPAAETFDAGVAAAGKILAALDERARTLAAMEANSAVKGGSQLGRRRKDNFSEGASGGWLSQAVDVDAQARRESAQIRELKENAAQTDEAMSARARSRWDGRAAQLRQEIVTAYARLTP